MSANNCGLRQRLVRASSVEELTALMKEGEAYKQVDPKTVRRWKRAYNVSLDRLSK